MSSLMKTFCLTIPRIAFSIFFLAASAFSHAVVAQTTTSARGTVTDASSGEPLAFASVQFEDKSTGTRTDAEGRFAIEINEPAKRLKITYLGYQPAFIDLRPGQANDGLVALLEEASQTLKEVVVRNEKYRNKGNPAVELIRNVIENKARNRREGLDYYSFEQYDKVEFAINNIDDKMRNNLLFRKLQFVFANADTSAQGVVSLPFYLYERIADVYYRKSPNAEKFLIKGEQNTSLPGFLDEDGVASYVQNMYQDVDIYDNSINVANAEFVSPLSPIAPNMYRFYIQDTVRLREVQAVRLYFAPRVRGDRAFEGNMWVALDGSYAVRKIEIGVPKEANLNWIGSMVIQQEFDWTESNDPALGTTRRLMLIQDEVLMHFGVKRDSSMRGLVGRKTSSYRNYTLNQPISDEFFGFAGNVRYADNVAQNNEKFWAENRHVSLNHRELGIQKTIDTLNNHRPFKRFLAIARIFFEGYHDIGGVEIGPVNTFYSFNDVEGFRARLGGRTNARFSKNLLLEGYAAYGFKDERWKSYFGATYSFGNAEVRRYPFNQARIWFQDEVQIPGQALQFVQEDNFLLSFKRGVNDKMIYRQVIGAEYINESQSGISYTATFKNQIQEPAGALRFHYGKLEQPQTLADIRTTEFGIHLRFAPNEKFYQGANFRRPIINRYPIFNLWFTHGDKHLLQGQYTYNVLQFKASKYFFTAPIGWAQVIVEGGRTMGTVPFPLLTVHRANQTYSLQPESYNLMNFLEFVSDKYAAVTLNHNFGGIIFNRIPLFNRLKWREMFTFKALWGGLDETNRPTAENGLLHFPTSPDGTPLTYTLEKKPYMEASVGIGNIFKVLRVDYIRRLSYLDHPNVAEWGVRARVQLEF
ncbi:MAG: DUF5686 family protein [Saprospiraceae bacterium]